jgi:hypothetical protein
MDPHRRPPVLDMTPEGDFRDPPGPLGAAPRRASALDRVLAKVGGLAVLVALAAGGLLLAGLAVLFVGLILPVLIVAGLVGVGSLWWRMRRARQRGEPLVVVVRR